MLKHLTYVFVLFVTIFPTTLQALPIQYDFRAPFIEDLDGGPQLNLKMDSIILTAATNDGVFNRTAAGFGINAVGSGDDTDALDGGSGILEDIAFIFSTDVILNGFTVSGLGSLDAGSFSINALAPVMFNNTGFIPLNDVLLSGGKPLKIRFVAGNGFSLDSLSVSPYTVAEPGTLMLMILSLGLLVIRRWIGIYDKDAGLA